jgi:ligand-binding sensor domain-containing protein
MMRWIHYSIKVFTQVLICVLPLGNAGHCQVNSFRHYGLDKNVFPSRIECVQQSSTGALLVGTLAGLVEYNGEEFKQYTKRDGLAENAVSAIGVHKNHIWLGHWAGSMTRIDASTNEFTAIDIRSQLNFSSILSIHPFGDSAVLIVTRGGSLFEYSTAGLVQIVIQTKKVDEAVLNVVFAGDKAYIVTQQGIYASSDKGSLVNWEKVFEPQSPITYAFRIQESEWIISASDHISSIDIESKKEHIIYKSQSPFKVVSMIQDQEEFIWIGTAEQGIIQYHPITNKLSFFKRDNGLSYNQIRSLFLDREGSVWIATSTGLDQYQGRAFILYDKKSGVPDNLIWDFIDIGEKMLVASPSGLQLILEDVNSGKFIIQKSFELGGHEPRKIFKTRSGQEIYVIDANFELWKSTDLQSPQLMTGMNSHVRCLEEVNGEIWVGTDDGIFVIKNDKPTEQFTSELGLGGNKVNGIYYSKVKNETWITVLGGPAILYKEGRFKRFGPELGLTSNVVQDAAFDRNGNPWFATYDDGVFYFENDQFINLREKVELTSNTTFAISIDEKESVWIGHSWGLDMYRIPFDDAAFFGIDQGFMGIEVNPSAIECLGSNQVWMGTLMGLLKFNPNHFRLNISEPVTQIKSATLSGQNVLEYSELNFSGLNGNDLKVEFSGISLVNPGSNVYEYRLVGMHSNWRSQITSKPIEYKSLSPGDYTFELRTCNNSGNCNLKPQRFEFVVKPPFYKTWWFYTLLFLFVVFAIFIMDRYRVLALLDERNELNEKLAIKDHGLIEAEQVISQLESRYDQSIQISNEVLTAERDKILYHNPRLNIHGIPFHDISSDQLFALQYGDMELVGLVDLNLSDGAVPHLLEHIKSNFYQLALGASIHSPKDFLAVLNQAVKAVVERLEKYLGLSWVIWFEQESTLLINILDFNAFLISKDEVIELVMDKESPDGFLEIQKVGRLIGVSDGFAKQLADDANRAYGSKRLYAKVQELRTNKSSEIVSKMQKDFDRWRGIMEQQDDVTILILDYE